MIRKEYMYRRTNYKNWILSMILFFSFGLLFFATNVNALSCEYTSTYQDKYGKKGKGDPDSAEAEALRKSTVASGGCRYADFDWDSFYDANVSYWNGECRTEEDKVECESKILETQKKFYKKLYKALANYEKEGLFINDNVIIETVIFELTPSTMAGAVSEDDDYESYYDSYKKGYIHDGDEDDIDANDDQLLSWFKQYFEQEKDSLMILIKNMVAYKTICYGRYPGPTYAEDDVDHTNPICDQGGDYITSKSSGNFCGDQIAINRLGFWEYFISKIKNFLFLGKLFPDAHEKFCIVNTANYPASYVYDFDPDREINYAKYFEFLSTNRYFDRKAHLQHYFYERVLKPEEVDCLTSDVCKNSLESKGGKKYDEYEDTIMEIRMDIVDYIKGILERYGIYIDAEGYIYNNGQAGDGDGYGMGSGIFGSSASCLDNMTWPIGSESTSTENGVTYAMGAPVTTKITSGYGPRNLNDPGASTFHKGIDIGAGSYGSGVINVIAAADGVVQSTFTNCPNDSNSNSPESDKSCGSRYGNHIVIEHSNGNKTRYAHLAYQSITVNTGDTVKRGQVIAKVGSTGGSTGPHLHFEVEAGGERVDPTRYVSDTNTRPECSNTAVATGELARDGKYGSYYGNDPNSSQPLTMEQMRVNAQYIYVALSDHGWSKNAICGLLGNMQHESSLNPGRWQSDKVGRTGSGYGLVQWTPATKYIDAVGGGDYSTMDNNIERIIWEVNNNKQYYSTSGYPLSFREFTTSNKDPYYLACAFAWNYERSWTVLYGTESAKESVRQARGGAANSWCEYLSSVSS